MSGKCCCVMCDRDVPANVDGTPKRHNFWFQNPASQTYEMCPGGSNLHGVLMSDPMALALVLGLKTSTLRNSPRWANAEKGDRIYVKEAYAVVEHMGSAGIAYRADGNEWLSGWENAMFAPFRVCRTIRTLTAKPHLIRPQDLTLDQIMAEGVRVLTRPEFRVPEKGRKAWERARDNAELGYWRVAFECLWIAINGEKSWRANEPAYLIEFTGAKP